MAALISRFVNVPIASARPARCPPQLQPGSHPSWLPCGWLKDCVQEDRRELSSSFFFFSNNCHPFVGNLSLTTSAPAYLYLILYPLCTLSLSVSLSTAPSLIPSHPRRLSLFYCSLFLVRCLPLSGKQLFLSAQPTLSPFTVSSPCSLTPPRLLLFISFPLSVPLSSPLIPTHSVFIRLCSLSQFG